jgi:hypothetical protein
MSRVSERLNSTASLGDLISVLKELADDQYREPSDRFTVEELAEIAESCIVVVRMYGAMLPQADFGTEKGDQ